MRERVEKKKAVVVFIVGRLSVNGSLRENASGVSD